MATSRTLKARPIPASLRGGVVRAEALDESARGHEATFNATSVKGGRRAPVPIVSTHSGDDIGGFVALMPEMPVQETSLDFPRFGAARTAIGKLLYWRYRLFQKRRHDTAVLERIGDFPLIVMPGVLNPRLTRSGEFFASQLSAGLVARGMEVLDMGTGSGVCAIVVARQARRVVAVDINPAAVRCARINTLLNHLEDRIEVTQGDLFAPVEGRRFDVVLFNPPFIHGTPSNEADRAWRSTDVAERFAEGLVGHLTPAGFALVVLSTYGDAGRFVRHFRRCGFDMTLVAVRTFINEQLTLVRLQRPPRSGSVP